MLMTRFETYSSVDGGNRSSKSATTTAKQQKSFSELASQPVWPELGYFWKILATNFRKI